MDTKALKELVKTMTPVLLDSGSNLFTPEEIQMVLNDMYDFSHRRETELQRTVWEIYQFQMREQKRHA